MHTRSGLLRFLRGRAGLAGQKRNRPTLIFGTLAAVLVLFLAFQTLAFAVHELGLFELDRNAVDDPNVAGQDWDDVYAASIAVPPTHVGIASTFVHDGPDPDTPVDNTYFTQGSSDVNDINTWFDHGNNAPDKDEITNAYAAAYKYTPPAGGPDHTILFFGADRLANNGDSDIGFWFFHNPISINTDGSFNGVHAVGDILTVSAFTAGGGISTIDVYEWVGSGGNAGGGTLQVLFSGADCVTGGAGASDYVCATVNDQTETAPWPFTPKFGTDGTFPHGSFYEGGIDLTQALPGGLGCFSSFLAETRASQSLTAALHDLALGSLNTCQPLDVSKTAQTSLTRTYNWTIAKSVDPATWNLFQNDSGTSQYTVSVVKTGSTDSNWAVTGSITIQNPNPNEAATITGVSDSIGGIAATVSCPVTFPYSLAGGGTLNCTYTASLPDGTTRNNTATVTTTGPIGGGMGQATVDFSTATVTEVNSSIHVTDTNGGSWTFSDGGSQTYTKTFTCNADQGTHNNTATITETGQSASASVTVNCYALTTTKTASTARTRTFPWTIAKSVTPTTWNLFQGDSGTSQYTVSVTKGAAVDSNLLISGNIAVHNPAPVAATLNTVTDAVSGLGAATVNCGVSFPYMLAGGGTLNCTYSAVPPDESDRTNTATATLQNHSYDYQMTATATGTTDFSGSAAVSFASATTTLVNDTIHVTDTNGGSWTFSDGGSQTYTKTFTCNTDQGTHNNTATITETGQSASASVTVNCYALGVTKDASTSLTRTWSWTIQKTGDQNSLTLATGESYVVNYSIVVNATSADSAWGVSGNISVHNPAPVAATINSVADVVSPAIAATVDCGVSFPYSLAAGGTLNCTYTASLPDATSRTNTATATLQNHSYDYQMTATATGTTDFTGSAAVSFASATINSVDECIHVTDTYAGDLGTVCAGVDALPKTFTYSRTIGPYDVCGTYTVDNTSAFVTNDTGTTGDSSWTVNINVPCVGCTLTYGYWKTHSNHGPAPFDDTWNQILPSGADSPFFLSGQTYYEVLWTTPKGNAYYILADQYIAAVLNQLNGASTTPDVDAAMAAALSFFQTYTPTSNLSKAQRTAVIGWATTLENYNTGLIGPGHCSEQASY